MAVVRGFGHRAYLQFGPKEATFGTFQTPTQKLEVINWKIVEKVGVIRDASLYNQMSRRANYQAPIYFKGTFTVRLNFEGLLELFRGVFPTYAATVVEGTSRDHVFKEGPALNSYSFEVSIGDIPTSKVHRLLGAKLLPGLTIKGQDDTGNGSMLTAEFSVWARDLDTNAGAGYTPTAALSFPAVLPVLYHQSFRLADGTGDADANIRMRSFEFSYEQPHDEERFYGSFLADEPLRSDFITPTLKLTEDFVTMSALTAARAFSNGAPKLIFQHPTALVTHTSTVVTVNAGTTITRASGSFIADGWVVGDHVDDSAFVPGGTYVTAVAALTLTVSRTCTSSGGTVTVTGGTNREFEIRMGTANLVDDPQPPIEGFGALISTLTWEGVFDTTDASAAVVRFRSTEAALP